MSRLTSSLFSTVVAAAVTAGGLYYFRQQPVREASMLRSQNSRLRFQANQWRAAQQAAAPSTVVAPSPIASAVTASHPAAPRVVQHYRNEGQATPVAALQTFAWACDRGDTDAVAKLVFIEPLARTKAESYLVGLPASARTQWKSVDEMAVTLLIFDGMTRPFPSADIIATATTESLSDDRLMIRLPNTPRDRMVFQKTNADWRFVITEAAVEKYVARQAQR